MNETSGTTDSNKAAPALLPRKKRRLLKACIALLVCGIVAIIALLPYVRSQMKLANYVRAVGNTKQIYMLLSHFNRDYGRFPDATTATKLKAAPGHSIPLEGTSSNAYLRQLIAGGYIQSEEVFFARIPETRKADNLITENQALALGECGFAYVTGMTMESPHATPLLMAPMIPGSTKFDPKPFDGKAVIMRISGGTTIERIAPDGHVYTNGMDLFDPRQPYWEGKVPVIAYPE